MLSFVSLFYRNTVLNTELAQNAKSYPKLIIKNVEWNLLKVLKIQNVHTLIIFQLEFSLHRGILGYTVSISSRQYKHHMYSRISFHLLIIFYRQLYVVKLTITVSFRRLFKMVSRSTRYHYFVIVELPSAVIRHILSERARVNRRPPSRKPGNWDRPIILIDMQAIQPRVVTTDDDTI